MPVPDVDPVRLAARGRKLRGWVSVVARDTIDVVSKAGGCPRHLAAVQNPGGISMDEAFVYFADSMMPDGRVLRVPRTGGPATAIVEHENGPGTLAVDTTSVYWNSRQ